MNSHDDEAFEAAYCLTDDEDYQRWLADVEEEMMFQMYYEYEHCEHEEVG